MLLIFCVTAKLEGAAKVWVDTSPTFTSWEEMKRNFIKRFTPVFNEADVHIALMKRKRQPVESLLEYLDEILKIGSPANVSEAALVKYFILGMKDDSFHVSVQAQRIDKISDLRDRIEWYYSIKYAPAREKVKPVQHGNEIHSQPTNISSQNEKSPITCFNCREKGHMSRECPKPQRKLRCNYCKKTTHESNKCPTQSTVQIKRITTRLLYKEIKVNGKTLTAYIDLGSDCSTIRRSDVPSDVTVMNTVRVLNGFGGGYTVCNHQIDAELEIDSVILNTTLLVVDDELLDTNVLLGQNCFNDPNIRIVQENQTLNIEEINKEKQQLMTPYKLEEINMGDDISEQEKLKTRDLVNEFRHCFAETIEELGTCETEEMIIQLMDEIPVNQRPYRIPFGERETVRSIVEQLLKNNIIRESSSPYSSPVVLVRKSNGEPRLCIDYRRLNAKTIKQPYQMPIVEEQLCLLQGNKYFTKLDVRSGYHQIKVAESSRRYTAFCTNDGQYEYCKMPFGLTNAPAVFQRAINKIAAKMPGELLTYIDDIIIPSKSIEEGYQKLRRFLVHLQGSGFTLRRDKCEFFQQQITFLGHEISQDGISPGRNKTNCVTDFPHPNNVHKVRQFLGLSGYFRKFICNYAGIARPLTKLLQKDEPFVWTNDQENSFQLLKTKLTQCPVLTLYNPVAEHEIHTDASSFEISGMLMQKGEDNNMRPVHYYSRHTTISEANFSSYELEILAIVESLNRFRVYIMGKRVRVLTDCAAISTTKLSKTLQKRIARWWLKMSEYDFELVHRSGSSNKHADALSRQPIEQASEADIVGNDILKIQLTEDDWLMTMQRQDEKIREIIEVLQSKQKGSNERKIQQDYCIQKNGLFRKLTSGNRWVVPHAVRWRVVKMCHDDIGHLSIDRTLERCQRKFWFARMRNFIKGYIASCVQCCYFKRVGGRREGQLHSMPRVLIPFQTIHLDHEGPYPVSKRRNSHILVAVDAFTKYVIIRAVKSTATQPVLAILSEMSSYFGLPTNIITDRGTAFTSKTFEKYCHDLHIKHIKTAVRTPRANGQVERVHQVVRASLTTMVGNNDRDWDNHLRVIQWTINTTPNATTKRSPCELVFDYKPRDILTNELIFALHDADKDKECSNTSLQDRRKEAAKEIELETAKWKQRFDAKHKYPTVYDVDNMVVVHNEPTATGESRKLEPLFKGPYIITKVLPNDRYVVEDLPDAPRTQRPYVGIFSSDNMKLWCTLPPDNDDSDEDGDVLKQDGRTVNPETCVNPEK